MGMSELEYWKKTAELYQGQVNHLEDTLKSCNENYNTLQDMINENTHNMTDAHSELFALKDRIQEANNILMGRLKAAQLMLSARKETDSDHTKGYAAGQAATLVFITELLQKAIHTNEPLP